MLYPMHTVSAIATPRIAHLGSAARARNTRNLNGTENERQVLSLYRTVLRTARDKDSQAESIAKFARSEFERHRQVDRKNYQLIEHLMRKAKRQLAMVQQKQVTGVKML